MDHPSEAEKGEGRAVNECSNRAMNVAATLTELIYSLLQCVIGHALPRSIYSFHQVCGIKVMKMST